MSEHCFNIQNIQTFRKVYPDHHTSFLDSIAAPFSIRNVAISVFLLSMASIRAVLPTYQNV